MSLNRVSRPSFGASSSIQIAAISIARSYSAKREALATSLLVFAATRPSGVSRGRREVHHDRLD